MSHVIRSVWDLADRAYTGVQERTLDKEVELKVWEGIHSPVLSVWNIRGILEEDILDFLNLPLGRQQWPRL